MRCSLSLRERARVRGAAACNPERPGAAAGGELWFPWLGRVNCIGSSRPSWFARRFFPPTPPFSRRTGSTAHRPVGHLGGFEQEVPEHPLIIGNCVSESGNRFSRDD